jgi:hypothetical protein
MRRIWFVLIFLCSTSWMSAQSTATPELGLDVNAQTDAVVANGWPLLIRAAVISANGQPLQIGVNNGFWTQALRLTVTGASGAQSWPVQLLPPSAATLSLSGIHNAEAVWVVDPSDTTAIPAGLYTLSVTLDTTATASSGDWSGAVNGNHATVQFQAEPASLSSGQTASKYLAFAAYGRLHGDSQGAGTALDTLIGLQPDSLEPYKEKGDLLAAGGNYAGALALYQQAIQKFTAANPNPPEPPTALVMDQLDIAESLANQMMNVNAQVQVTTSGLVYSRVSREFSGTMTVINTGSAAIAGPISVALSNLPAQMTLDNATGTLGLGGSPYIRVLNSGSLGVGQSAAITIRFGDPSMAAITFTPVVYSGL